MMPKLKTAPLRFAAVGLLLALGVGATEWVAPSNKPNSQTAITGAKKPRALEPMGSNKVPQ